MPTERRMRLAAPDPKDKKVVPLEQRGKMMFVADVVALFRGKKSEWWVRNKFAPDKKHYTGRTPYWWECDVQAALDADAA